MSKIGRGPRFLRMLWVCFVVAMTSLLIAAVVLLIHDFLRYYVSVHTELLMDEESDFPAITVCHHHPFSKEAYELWNSKKVLSPTGFNRYLRNLTYHNLMLNNINGVNMFSYDSLSVYYQNLKFEEALSLGHPHTIFLNCMQRKYKYDSSFEDDCRVLEGYKIRLLSYHQFFNCYTFEPKNKEELIGTDFLSLIVSLGPKPDYNINEQAFIVDIFEQARGLRVVVHEPGTFPDIEQQGLHVEPGKLNEINYQHVQWQRLNTPSAPCITINSSHNYQDLNETYVYEHTQCILWHQQLEVMDKCGCMFIMNPRPQMPSENMPYCGKIMPEYKQAEFDSRLECIKVKMDPSIKRKYDGKACLPRCSYPKYESTISITKWRAKEWQLYWLRLQNRAYKMFERDYFNSGKTTQSMNQTEAYKIWMKYLQKKNLTDITDVRNELNLEGDNFAYVVLKRKTPNTIMKSEKLVLTLYVLLSRIGGLCSLSIGLTAAFAVELVEFFYLYCENRINYYEHTGSAGRRRHKNLRAECHADTRASASDEIGQVPVEIEVNEFANNRNGVTPTDDLDLMNSPMFSQMVRIGHNREHFL